MTRREKKGLTIAIAIGIAVEILMFALYRFIADVNLNGFIMLSAVVVILGGFAAWIEAHTDRLGD